MRGGRLSEVWSVSHSFRWRLGLGEYWNNSRSFRTLSKPFERLRWRLEAKPGSYGLVERRAADLGLYSRIECSDLRAMDFSSRFWILKNRFEVIRRYGGCRRLLCTSRKGERASGTESGARRNKVNPLALWLIQCRQMLGNVLHYAQMRNSWGSYQRIQPYHSLTDRIRRLDSSMQYREYHTLRWTAGLLLLGSCAVYVYQDDVKRWFGDTSADITSSTLRDTNVQREAQNLAQGVVYELLNDANALKLASQFVHQLLERENTRRAVIELLAHVVALEETQNMLQRLFVRVLQQPAFLDQATLFTNDILTRESTKVALRELFAGLFADPTCQEYMAQFFRDVMQTDTFRTSVNDLSAKNVQWLLENDELTDMTVDWLKLVLSSPSLQNKAADVIWGAVTATFVPGFLGGNRSSVQRNIDAAKREVSRQASPHISDETERILSGDNTENDDEVKGHDVLEEDAGTQQSMNDPAGDIDTADIKSATLINPHDDKALLKIEVPFVDDSSKSEHEEGKDGEM